MVAGHSSIEMMEQYTFIDLGREGQLTQAIQDRLATVRKPGEGKAQSAPRSTHTGDEDEPPLPPQSGLLETATIQ